MLFLQQSAFDYISYSFSIWENLLFVVPSLYCVPWWNNFFQESFTRSIVAVNYHSGEFYLLLLDQKRDSIYLYEITVNSQHDLIASLCDDGGGVIWSHKVIVFCRRLLLLEFTPSSPGNSNETALYLDEIWYLALIGLVKLL